MSTDEIMALADALSQAAYNLATPDHYDHEAKDEARATLLAAVEQLTKDAGRYRELLSEVSRNFTRDDDLPDNLLPRIDAAMQPIQPKQHNAKVSGAPATK